MRFEGYKDPAANAKKILRDVFAKGDMYFRRWETLPSFPAPANRATHTLAAGT
jgi:hypothetical protein